MEECLPNLCEGQGLLPSTNTAIRPAPPCCPCVLPSQWKGVGLIATHVSEGLLQDIAPWGT